MSAADKIRLEGEFLEKVYYAMRVGIRSVCFGGLRRRYILAYRPEQEYPGRQ
jgi:hypothetical protein